MLAAHANEPKRTWEFKLHSPGTYKLQVRHVLDGVPPRTQVRYEVTIGSETRSRQLDLVANRPFVPLVADVFTPRSMRVVITGLSSEALKETQVFAYRADSVPHGEFFDPAKHGVEDVARLREILQRTTDSVDLGTAKVAIDHMIDPTIDVSATLMQLERMLKQVAAMREFGMSASSRLSALKRYLYQPGDWNGHEPFTYDLDDPLGADIQNKLLANYLRSRKGNCVTMPFLLIVLGNRFGLEMTASTAPNHVFVKFRHESGAWINLEATSGANPARDAWIRQQHSIADDAIRNAVYLQPLTRRETVALMATTVAEHGFRRGEYEKAIALSDLILEYNPRDVGTMVLKAVAYGRLARARFVDRHPTPGQIPNRQRPHYEYLSRSHHQWFGKAEALGWREESKEREDKYLELIKNVRQQKLKGE